jgi:hypothetical protein
LSGPCNGRTVADIRLIVTIRADSLGIRMAPRPKNQARLRNIGVLVE